MRLFSNPKNSYSFSPLKFNFAVHVLLAFLICLLPHLAAVAQTSTSALIAAAKAGELSLDELADSLILSAEQSPGFINDVFSLNVDIPGFSEVLGPEILNRTASFLKVKSAVEADGLMFLGRKILGEQNDYYKKMLALLAASRKVDMAIAANDTGKAVELISTFSPLERKVALGRLTDFFRVQIAKATDNPDRFASLKRLAQIDSLHGGETEDQAAAVIGLLRRDLEAGNINLKQWNLDDPLIQPYLEQIIAKNSTAKNDLTEIYSRRASELMEQGDPTLAELALKWVIQRRPDPSEENNDVRLTMVFAAESPLAREYAVQLLQQLREARALGPGTKIRLVFAGYYGGGVKAGAILFLVLLAAGSAAAVYFYIRIKTEPAEKRKSRQARGKHGYKQMTEDDDEYTKLLATFNLDDRASESQIKKAYREAVKKHHPDKHGASGVARDSAGNVDDTFQELHKTYERIMEIRGGWFGGKKRSR